MAETTANTQQFTQKSRSFKLGNLVRKFSFGTENLTYTIADKTGERTLDVPYETIDVKNKQMLVTNNSQHRRQAMSGMLLIWSLLMLIMVGFHADPVAPAIISVATSVALIIIFLRTRGKTKKTIFKAQAVTIEVFQDEQHDTIIEQLKSHWLARLRNLHLNINPLRVPEQEIAKYEWLKKNGVISDQEFADAVTTLQRVKTERRDFPLPGEQKLN